MEHWDDLSEFELRLRIPGRSECTRAALNGEPLDAVPASTWTYGDAGAAGMRSI